LLRPLCHAARSLLGTVYQRRRPAREVTEANLSYLQLDS
jgi:hypothetical protein